MDKPDLKLRIQQDIDYIRYPKLGNSLERFVNKYPNGVEDTVIARILMISEEEVEKIYQEAVVKLRSVMVESGDDNSGL